MGVPPKRIASILGHDGTRTTETVYLHGQEVIDMTGDEFETCSLRQHWVAVGSRLVP